MNLKRRDPMKPATESWGTNYLITTNKGGVKITRAKTPPGKYEPRDSFMGQITGTWRTVK